jgi:nucleoside-diphosphate-sugar epimerase
MQDVLTNFRGKKIGVVGLGYIGKYLFHYLSTYSLEFDYSVEAFGRGNISSLKDKEFHYFFNCAGNTGDFRTRLWATIDSNLFLTQFILENCHISECYVAISSTRLYGFSENKDILFEESGRKIHCGDHLSTDFVYDGTKMLLESALWNYSKKVDFKISICRLSNLYGRYSKEDLNDSTYLKLLIRAKIEGSHINVEQNISNTKGYIFIDDAIMGLIHSAAYADKSDIYNVCSGQSYSLEDWLKYLQVSYTVIDNNKPSLHSRISILKAVKELKFIPTNFLQNTEFNKIFQHGSNTTI